MWLQREKKLSHGLKLKVRYQKKFTERMLDAVKKYIMAPVSTFGNIVGHGVDTVVSTAHGAVGSFSNTDVHKSREFNALPPAYKDYITGMRTSSNYQVVQQHDNVHQKQNFGAVGDATASTASNARVSAEQQRAFLEAASKATATNSWSGRSYSRVGMDNQKKRMAQKPERPPSTPMSYQQAILNQPMPMLSPLRGSSAPQGIRAISDALLGTTMTTYNPALPALSPPVPSTVSAGSLNAQVQVRTPGSEDTTSGFSSRFGNVFGSAPKAINIMEGF
jgi:hypothetical protein